MVEASEKRMKGKEIRGRMGGGEDGHKSGVASKL